MQYWAACTMNLYKLTKLRLMHANSYIQSHVCLTSIFKVAIHFDHIIKDCIQDIYSKKKLKRKSEITKMFQKNVDLK